MITRRNNKFEISFTNLGGGLSEESGVLKLDSLFESLGLQNADTHF